MALTDFAQGLIALVPQVARIRSELDDLTQQVKEIEGRLAIMENSGDLTAEKARNAALQATIDVTQRLSEKMRRLESQLAETDRVARG